MHRGLRQGRPLDLRSLATLALVILLAAGSVAMVAGARPAAAVDFTIGDTAIVDSDELNLRAEPTLDAEVVTVMTAGTVGLVTDGPVEADGYTWFAVTGAAAGDGWVAGQFLQGVTSTETVAATVEAGATPAATAGT